MKKFLCVLLAVIVSISAISLVGCDVQPDVEEPEVALNYNELKLPEGVEDDIGLYFFDSESYSFIKVTDTTKTINFDVNKPTIFYTHGQGYHGPGMDNTGATYYSGKLAWLDEYWDNADYNVLSFQWAPLAGFASPWDIQENIWTDMKDGKATDDDGNISPYHEHCAAEIFGVAIYSFLGQYPDYTLPIRLEGLSMGGQLVCATASYLETKASKGVIDKKYVPERVTMCDPFLTNGPMQKKIAWLDENIGSTGSVGLMIRVCNHLHEAGIAMEYFHTGYGDAGNNSTNPDANVNPAEYIDLWNATCFADYCTDYGKAYINKYYQDRGISMMSDLESYYSSYHVAGVSLYAYMIECGILYDVRYEGELAFGAATPTSYTMARVGDSYYLDEIKDYAYVEDDQLYVAKTVAEDGQPVIKPITYGKVAGYISEDKNDNGLLDENMAYRVCDVKVNLYVNGNKIASTVAKGGYYEFVLTDDYNGRDLKVEFELPTGYTIGKATAQNAGDAYYLMNNELTSATSAEFSFEDVAGHVKIINAGLKKN